MELFRVLCYEICMCKCMNMFMADGGSQTRSLFLFCIHSKMMLMMSPIDTVSIEDLLLCREWGKYHWI